MGAVIAVIKPLASINAALLAVGRGIGATCVALMVVAILIQVFCRYILNNALPWPDEAARFAMMWMAGLMAPTALRNGSFVAIDMISGILPGIFPRLLSLFLLSISGLVLFLAVKIGWSEVTGFGGRFATASLYVPTSLGFDEWHRVPRSWMMASLLVGCAMLLLVNVELILRQIVGLMGGADRLPRISGADIGGAD
jgi:TRAP-type C4-dicarboxylate transport system permease small subunit